MKKFYFLMLVVFISTSCATGYYASKNVNQFGAQTQVVLNQANFRIVRHLEVVVDVNNSNLKRADVEKSAYAELLRRANLTGSQALINVVIEEVRRESSNIFSVLFAGGIRKYTQHIAARATIIEFIDESGNPIQSVSIDSGTAPRMEIDEANNMLSHNRKAIVINSKWKKFTKEIAESYNNGYEIDSLYDLDGNGELTVEELDNINKAYIQSNNYQNSKQALRVLIEQMKANKM